MITAQNCHTLICWCEKVYFCLQSTFPATSLLIRIEEKNIARIEKAASHKLSQFVLSCPGKLTINELISNVGIELH